MVKILLAEDDLFLRDIYLEVLRDSGFDVTPAVNGEEALQLLKKGGWDMVLMDDLMPRMSGIEVLKQIKSSDKKYAKHIVFLTNSDITTEFYEVKDMIDGFLLKSSYTPDQLVTRIRSYLQE